MLVLDDYMGQIKVLARAWADGLGVDNRDIKSDDVDRARVGDVAIGGDPVGEVDVRAQDLRSFLQKSESSKQLI